MEYLDSFAKARHFYNETWASERREILKELESIRDEVQRQAKLHSIGSITYSSAGLVGGGLAIAGIITAPFTFRVSLGLTVAGVATGVTSGVAGVTHGAVKTGIVQEQISNAKTSLENHDKHCKEMKSLLELLKQDIETIEANIKDSNELKTSYLVQGIKETGIVIDLWSLYCSTADLSKFNKGQLCSEAEKLQKVIEQMQHEYDVLT